MTIVRAPLVFVMLFVAVSGCDEGPRNAQPAVEGNPQAGAAAIASYGCGTCHMIPGIPGADATAGPPLGNYARRVYVAGVLPNTPDDLVRWIRHPQEVDPRTAMPELGVTEEEARDIAAYLYTRTGGRW
ncbi:c-type cytochrome [Chelativorans salis]|uniref:C-type cytochrome n=1 Tax=Chelativorans salis TaxID=2978478 RepID=A0ABT2LPD8_9HYPH|nr:c-type cytochrome [Chelativorans sp. EGI FJ00035]MCT7376284.1 c-type cytochrome [Chelativorans sp. EGI FJ00035]